MYSYTDILKNNNSIILNESLRNSINSLKEQLIIDGGVVTGESLLNCIDDTIFAEPLIILPYDFSILSWICFEEIERDKRICITEK